jgi:hypothetical protein
MVAIGAGSKLIREDNIDVACINIENFGCDTEIKTGNHSVTYFVRMN